MDASQGFVEEIEFEELKFKEVVGRGAFGVVSRATWRGKDVAVKLIETEAEKKAFLVERNQLSRVSHPNIVKLYGASSKAPVCLVMEYAEGGSLYNVLHGSGPLPEYNTAHAMSWCYQCAKGVEYLHGMKPKALIHRDLKPPNLLLVSGGTVLKICDFGTACDMQTHMTNNKGSAAWMAPEVFEGSNYSEKCDVFSWGIILWEVITRKKPFDEIGGPAFRIMWAVHTGTRPPLVKDMPKPLEILMTRCWSPRPVERPPMAEVSRIMAHLFQFFKGADEPLVYPLLESDMPVKTSAILDTPSEHTNTNPLIAAAAAALHDTVRSQGEPVPIVTPTTPRSTPIVVEEESPSRTSAPASLAASRENLNVDIRSERDRHSADLSMLDGRAAGRSPTPPEFVRGHRRSGSTGNEKKGPPTMKLNIPAANQMHSVQTAPIALNGITQSGPEVIRSVSWSQNVPSNRIFPGSENQNLVNASLPPLRFDSMDYRLQPLAPCQTSQESMDVYRQHWQLAQEYLQAQAELEVLTLRSQQLTDELQRDQQKDSQFRIIEEFTSLTSENEQLMMLYKNLKKQVELINQQQKNRYGQQHC